MLLWCRAIIEGARGAPGATRSHYRAVVQPPGLVLVSGAPASGKTTLATQLAARLDAQLLSKDVIKETLWDELGDDVALDVIAAASVRLLYVLAGYSSFAVLDSFFWTGLAEHDLRALGQPMVQVFCDCPSEVSQRRYFERARDVSRRDPRHDPEGPDESLERWRDQSGLLELDVPLLKVDTTRPVELEELTTWIGNALAES